MSQSQHAQDITLVDNHDSVYVTGSKSALQPSGSTQATDEIKPKAERQPLPPYLPYDPRQADRTLVLCFDGTGDQFGDDNSNIVQLVSMLKKDDKTKQMVYYQAGIGTYTSPAFVTPLMATLSKILDGMIAWNFEAHVIGGYEFLMQNYRPGDKICIFGFSRGAYTARSLAAMIHKVGIIPADNHQQVPFAYKMYTKTDLAQSKAFKQTFSVDVDIEFVGVWDTVDSIGIIPKYFPLTAGNSTIKTFRHAVSLDEHRSKFNANLWNRLVDEEKDLDIHNRLADSNKLQILQIIHQDGSDDTNEPIPAVRKRKPNEGATFDGSCNQSDCAQGHLGTLLPDKNDAPTDVEEVWFAGCHCDIGGGSVKNGTPHSLARIPLRWMVRECFKAKTGILFDTASLYTIGLDPATLYPHVLKRPPLSDSITALAREGVIQTPESTSWSRWFKSWFTSAAIEQNVAATEPDQSSQAVPFVNEDNEDLQDALSPKYDQLTINRLWWILELFPVMMRYQRVDNRWVSYTGINMGKNRFISNQHRSGVKVHRSVKLRMEAQHKDGSKYEPNARLAVEPTWI